MEKNRQHHHSQFVRLFKNVFAVFAFIVPIFFIFIFFTEWFQNPVVPINSLLELVSLLIFSPICILVAAYFYTDLEVDEDGMLVEFLWKKLRIPWNKVLQMKPLFGMKVKKQGIYVVMVDGLTPFHRLYGLIYGFSWKPAFVLWLNVGNFEVLKADIEKHVRRNHKLNL
ncbi:MAG: hypothetical protein HY865_02595 [Chloroflexi bacterium]|nr:hypothetical protein [Chloroflexota bacterium]